MKLQHLFVSMFTAVFVGAALAMSKAPKTVPKVNPVVVTPGNYVAAWDSKLQGKEWTQIVLTGLDDLARDLLLSEAPEDKDKWCPKFNELKYDQRKQFYLTLISNMAKFESSFKPKQTYTESFADSTGKNVVSRGLTQISFESSKAYGCDVKKPEDLHDPKVNLLCTVRIVKKWVLGDDHFGSKGLFSIKKQKWNWLGIARYWSVGRDTSDSQAKIKAQTMALSFCK